MEPIYLLFSVKMNAWRSHGINTSDVRRATQYPKSEALDVCARALLDNEPVYIPVALADVQMFMGDAYDDER